MNEAIIKLDHVSKFYKLYNSPKLRLKEALHPFGKKYHKEFYAIRDISLELKKGEVLGIVGKNGSGKSTLLKLIAGALVPSSGSVSVTGNVNALLELGSGLNPQFTGLQNIYFMGRIQGFGQNEMEGKVEEIIEFSELGEYINQPLRSYSSGMKSRLAFSIATTIQPEILILDEVLSVGDALFRRKSFARMEKLISENRTVLFVSHNEQSVKSICTRAILLDQGKLLYDGEPDDTVNLYLEILHSKDKDKIIEEKILKVEPVNSTVGEKTAEEAVVQTKSRQYSRYHNADIKDIELVRKSDGKLVKLLKTGEKYLVRFSVHLHDIYDNISGALTIIDDKGIKVAGIAPRLAGKTIRNDKADVVISLEFNLNCLLLPGHYYLDVSVMGDIDGVNKTLCAVRDAVYLHISSHKDECIHKFGFVNLLD